MERLTIKYCLILSGFKNIKIGFCKLFIDIKQLTTNTNNGKVPVHKNQKQFILKKTNQPSFEKKLKYSAFLKIKKI